MIVFSRPPGRRRRAGDPGSAGGFAEASVRTSSSGARALRWPRKATLRAALQALRTSSRGPCDGAASRRTTLLAEGPARPSDALSSYESKYHRLSSLGLGTAPATGGRTLDPPVVIPGICASTRFRKKAARPWRSGSAEATLASPEASPRRGPAFPSPPLGASWAPGNGLTILAHS